MKQKLTLSTLKALDNGKVNAMFEHHMSGVVKDCLDRPGDDTARSVTIKFMVKPQRGQDGDCVSLVFDTQVFSKAPAHRTCTYHAEGRKNGALLFNDSSPENVDQMSLDDEARRQSDEDKPDETGKELS